MTSWNSFGAVSELASKISKSAAESAAETPVQMKGDGDEEEDISFVYDFKYLGFWFQSDENNRWHLDIRMAMAGSAFGRLRQI